MKLLSKTVWQDSIAEYWLDLESGRVSLYLLPLSREQQEKFVEKGQPEPLVHVALRGDAAFGKLNNGISMKYAAHMMLLSYQKQEIQDTGAGIEIATYLAGGKIEAVHHLFLPKNCSAACGYTELKNRTEEEIFLEMASSFALGGLTPFSNEEDSENLYLHRLGSFWSAEGREKTESMAELSLEPSWSGFGMRNLRYGQTGSMPVRQYFPFGALEDRKNGVIWGTRLSACNASWQMEVSRFDRGVSLSGGLADLEFGHWSKKLAPGERFRTPDAILAVCDGGMDELTARLTQYLDKNRAEPPEAEQGLPLIFNEYCTTWGDPTEENLKKIADQLQGRGYRYFVIDAGWYSTTSGDWVEGVGDWNPAPNRFPSGLHQVVDYIRSCGMIPGIWFEFEVCTVRSSFFREQKHLLKRNGIPIQAGERLFLDMEDREVQAYLEKKVIGFLKEYGFGYLKVDYNENIGIGCDGAESLGEKLRRNGLATRRFFQKIREEIPGLVIELCSAGGHRLEPAMLSTVSMASFSDTHECEELPLVAGNVSRMVPASQSQIWAVVRQTDTPKRLYYSLSAAMLGRFCLSGDVCDLSAVQWEIIDHAADFYRREAAPVIQTGENSLFGSPVRSMRHPTGWQAIYRQGKKRDLVVIHGFAACPEEIIIPLKERSTIASVFAAPDTQYRCEENRLIIRFSEDWSGCALILE